MKKTSINLFKVLFVMVISIVLLSACSGDDAGTTDGDTTDGDTSIDGDTSTDGDLPTDGDEPDGDTPTDGDKPDGDTDGDTDDDADGDTDGDTEGDVEGDTETTCETDNPCTKGVYNEDTEKCEYSATADGTACDDENACTGLDACDSGVCVGSNPIVCDDPTECKLAGICNPSSGVCDYANAVDDLACNDDDSCTQDDACSAGVCVGSNPIVCDDPEQCKAAGICNPSNGVCDYANAVDDTDCNDGDSCTQTDACSAGVCVGSNPVVCNPATDCKQDGVCNPDTGVCFYAFEANDTSCDSDDMACTSDICDEGICVHNPQAGFCAIDGACFQNSWENPDNDCQICDTSISQTSWKSKNNSVACDDGNACTETDTCFNGSCRGEDEVVCDAPEQCKAEGVCNPSDGECDYASAVDNTDCDDDDACTQTDKCSAGMCEGSNLVSCDYPTQCQTSVICNGTTGECDVTNRADDSKCDDGNANTTDDKCDDGVCLGQGCTCGTVDSCCDGCLPINDGGGCTDDGAACTNDVCGSGVCTHPINDNFCFIGDVCFADGVINPAIECQYCDTVFSNEAWRNRINGTSCDDGDACTQTDECSAGACMGSNLVECAAPQMCKKPGVCNSSSGVCEFDDRDDEYACDDSDACTQTDKCYSGACVGSNPVDCPNPRQCELSNSCDSTSGLCVAENKINDTGCNDGNECTQTDTCQTGDCEGANDVVCADPDQCKEEGVCNQSLGTCDYGNLPDETDCDDDNACTQVDTCQGGTCDGSDPVTCRAATQCEASVLCNPASGACDATNKADDTPCEDEDDTCTVNDACQAGECLGDPKDSDSDTYVDVICGGNDCADNDSEVHPGHVEWCDEKDNNCLYGIDEGCAVCEDENYKPQSYNYPYSTYLPPEHAIALNRYKVTNGSVNILAVEGKWSHNNGSGNFHAVLYRDDNGMPGGLLAQSMTNPVTTYNPDSVRFDLTTPVAFKNGEFYWIGFIYDDDQTDQNNYLSLAVDDGTMTSEQNGFLYWPNTPDPDDTEEGWYALSASWIIDPIGCATGADIQYYSHSDNVSGDYDAGSGADITVTFENIGFETSIPLTVTLVSNYDAVTITSNSVTVDAITKDGTMQANEAFSLEFGDEASGSYYLALKIEDGTNTWYDLLQFFVNAPAIACDTPYGDMTGTFVDYDETYVRAKLFAATVGTMYANPYPVQADFTLREFRVDMYSNSESSYSSDYKFRVHRHGAGSPGEVLWESTVQTITSTSSSVVTPHTQAISPPITFPAGEVFWISIATQDDQSGTNWLLPFHDDGKSPSLNYGLASTDSGDSWISEWFKNDDDDYVSPMLYLFPKGCEGTKLTYKSHTDNSDGGIDTGDSVDITVTIENGGALEVAGVNGTLASTDADISVTDATAAFGTVPASGEKQATDAFTITVAADADEFQYPLDITLEDSNGKTWTDRFYITLNGGTVDLVVSNFVANLAGSNVTYEITVTNQGTVDINTEFRMDMYLDLEEPPVAGQITSNWTDTLGSLAAGADHTFSLNSASLPQGNYASYFQVDTTTLVSESDENNNIAGPEEFTIGENTFVLLDPAIKWFPADMPVDYKINPSGEGSIAGDAEFAEVDAGFQVWEDVSSASISFNNAGSTSSEGFTYDGLNTVSWEDPDNDLDSGVLAAAMPIWNSTTMTTNGTVFKRIIDADIVFNDGVEFCTHAEAQAPGCLNEFDIRGIATHEIGHLLGLNHPDVADATMYYATGPCNASQVTLEQSDINGVEFIYPE